MKVLNLSIIFAIAAVLVGCKASNPPLTGRPKPPPPAIVPKPAARNFERNFPFSPSEATAAQENYDINKISVNFQVKKGEQSINGLTEQDFRVSENGANGTPVTKFSLEKNVKDTSSVVDIVFAVDITGSMGPFIESAKIALRDFINQTRGKYRVRMCLSTFGDFVKKCDRFFDNSSATQVREFLTELSRLSIRRAQGEDPRFLDWEENSMRALTEATAAGWADGSQRFVILVSDADFYSPDKPNKFFAQHQADPRAAAPSMKEVNQAIERSGVRVFAITPPATGYNSPLAGEKDIVSSSQGEWFEFKRVINREITLDSIFKRILTYRNTTYTLSYIVEENPGLNPTVAIGKRNINIITASGEVKMSPPTSSLPAGRDEYKKEFKIAEHDIARDSMKVHVDGHELNPAEYSVQKNEVHFKSVPKPGSQMRFNFFYEAIEHNFRIEPMSLPGQADARNTKVYLNGKQARPEHLIFERDLDGNTGLRLSEAVLANNDPYEIRKKQGLNIRATMD